MQLNEFTKQGGKIIDQSNQTQWPLLLKWFENDTYYVSDISEWYLVKYTSMIVNLLHYTKTKQLIKAGKQEKWHWTVYPHIG